MQTSFEAGLQCTQCSNPLRDDDGHLLCPPCLGTEHLQEALSDPCPNCAIMSVEQRQTRLSSMAASHDLRSPDTKNKKPHKRRGTGVIEAEPKKRRSSPGLARQVGSLSAEPIIQRPGLDGGPTPWPTSCLPYRHRHRSKALRELRKSC